MRESNENRVAWARSLPMPRVRGLLEVFSGKIEDSMQLRLMGLAIFWLVALSVAWVGGNPWTWLGGGIATTCGYGFSWYRRHRSLGAWPVVMAAMVIGLAVIMRIEILSALEGNWLPLAHYLLLVQAIASFDIRTRGGLYAGLAMSGIVLFFASQQAFELSFGLFFLGYGALLLAFLATAYIEDETSATRSRSHSGRRAPLVGFWLATGTAVLAVSVVAFLLLPRGESNAVGYQQVTALPITGGQDGPQSLPQAIGQQSAVSLPSQGAQASGSASPASRTGDPTPSTSTTAKTGETVSTQPSSESPQAEAIPQVALRQDAAPLPKVGSGSGGAVMHVRSPVASYWRGQVFDTFDGRVWHPEESPGLDRPAGHQSERLLRYTQTFFVHRPQPGTTFTGYREEKVLSPEEALNRSSLGAGNSYRVVSVQPELAPEKLRQDRPGRVSRRYYELAPGTQWMPELADRITAGDTTGFDRAASIVEYLRQVGRYDTLAENQLSSSASLEDLLLEGKPGTSLDFATANVMLARAAGLPSRLATGYLPGERDLLSGAYEVHDEHAHAWAEVHFRDHGWVPFDGTHRPDPYAGGRAKAGQIGGLKYLFESSVGDELLRQVVLGPSRLSSELKDIFASPASAGLAAIALGAFVVGLVWLSMEILWKGRRHRDRRWSYTRLPGGGRAEMLRTYTRLERLLKSKGSGARRPDQTLQDYASATAEKLAGLESQLAWFTQAAWSAAYDPSGFPAEAVQEARIRLRELKAAMG